MMRLALPLLLGSIALCSCASTPTPSFFPESAAECPAPTPPLLPGLDPDLSLDHPANVETLMLRDDAMRGYIKGLRSSLECWKSRRRDE